MSDTAQWIIVGLILAAAIAYIIYRYTTRHKNAGNCNGCGDCPLTNNCKNK